ncbi:hypothetical protein ACFFJY_08215 [Fictibacillus aquaticus]|uniref:Metallo-beta-lactamase domain-containing protein n=1 Tax=Fictibacillus aquaticus TaxID=2021314 RepID=A0A235FAJ2_9BACL|nr:hypothetical protein [Fictibacillus aquaticus]OYD58302.1 hypothetical protein CGZ90_08045 [Fictibacillus aquaticus]
MKNFICATCGVQYERTVTAPDRCIICEDERQYVGRDGQEWTDLLTMTMSGKYQNKIMSHEDGLFSITTTPEFAIGQSAYLVQVNGFSLLWDCITYIDEETVSALKDLGGINGIALSHPHYYSSQAEWAERFEVPLYIHEDDKEWVTRGSSRIVFWGGEKLEIADGLTLIRLGGHFKGGSVLHWRGGDSGAGILLSGDIITVAADRKHVSFMYSYPNMIPLPAATVKRMAEKIKPYPFGRLYNAFLRIIEENADERVQCSAERYIQALNGSYFST